MKSLTMTNQLSFYVSEEQFKIYRKTAIKNRMAVAEWARTAIAHRVLPAEFPTDTTPLYWDGPIRQNNPRLSRSRAFTVRLSDELHHAIRKAAISANIKTALFCVIVLDHACGISDLVPYLIHGNYI
jgi:hypothetical protein